MKKFDTRQQQAIQAFGGSFLVLAPPGCGKTDILSERIVNARHNGVDFKDILCLTFTNRASRGMRDRIRQRIGEDARDVFTGNVHRFCSMLLYENSLTAENASIMDDEDLTDLLLNYDRDFFTNNRGQTDKMKITLIDDIDAYISQKQLQHPASAFYLPDNFDLYYNTALSIDFNPSLACDDDKTLKYALMYRRHKEERQLISFSDILIRAYDALRKDTSHKLKRYKWIQVDEVQDLNALQIAIIDELLDTEVKDHTIMYLGDEQQAIFSFLGAKLSCLNFLKERCKGHIITLSNNYRSPKYLTDVFNTYAGAELNVSPELLSDSLLQVPKQQYDLILTHSRTTQDEEARIGNMIRFYLRNDNERVALLVPTNAAADRISQQLDGMGIKHFKISGLDFFKTPQYKTLASFLSVCVNDFNALAWARLIHGINATNTYAQARECVESMKKLSMTPSDLLNDTSYLERFVETYKNKEMVFFDTETTGLNVLTDDIVQIAAFKVNRGEIVENSFFNVFIHTDKELPAKIGDMVNPLIEAYRTNLSCSKEEGLQHFLDYIGDRPILGHNVNFDYHILRNNAARYLHKPVELETYDSLHLIKCVEPNLKKYKLSFLLNALKLKGNNSHLADEDIVATKSLVDYCLEKSQDIIDMQRNFMKRTDISEIRSRLRLMPLLFAHVDQMSYQPVNDADINICHLLKTTFAMMKDTFNMKEMSDKFDLFLHFIQNEWQTSENITLNSDLGRHINDLTCGINEGDLINSQDLIHDRVFIMTVHKGKGLEFDNVVILQANDGTYPFYMTNKVLKNPWRFSDKEYVQAEEERMEDARKFYVALTRAKKRICVSYSYFNSYGMETHLTPFMKSIAKFFYGK